MCASILPAISLQRGKVATMNARPRKIGFRTLPDATVKELCARAARIKAALHRGLVEVGHELIEAKATLNHGQFGDWLEREVGMTPRTAQLIMRAYALISKNENFSLLGRSALFLLTPSDVPAATRDAVARLVEQGTPPAYTEVRTMISAARRSEPNSVSLAIRAEQPPQKAGVVDLATFRIVSVAQDAIEAGRASGIPERVEQFKKQVIVADIAKMIGGLVDTHDLRRFVTLCRAASAFTLGDLADVLERL
jgi:hypothetical protein